jgi:hypothetical protein
VAIISIPKPLREKLGDEGAEALVHMLNENEKELRSSVLDLAGQRFEQSLNREISAVRVDLAGAEKRFEKHLTEQISAVRGSIEKSRSDTTKWMFIFWIGQIGVLLGLLTVFFR